MATCLKHLAIFPRKVDFSCFGYHHDVESRLTFQGKWVLVARASSPRCAMATPVEQKSGHSNQRNFEDHYEVALAELLAKKQKGQPIAAAKKPTPGNNADSND